LHKIYAITFVLLNFSVFAFYYFMKNMMTSLDVSVSKPVLDIMEK